MLQRRGGRGAGFFCVLDCSTPVEWLCVDVATLGIRANEDLPISLLRAYADRDYSDDSTAAFAALIVKEAQALPQLSFAQLRREALEGRYR